MRQLSSKSLSKDNIVEAMNKEIVPFLRELRTFVLNINVSGVSDADVLELDYSPDEYVPEVVAGVTTAITQLSSHLKGINEALADLNQSVQLAQDDATQALADAAAAQSAADAAQADATQALSDAADAQADATAALASVTAIETPDFSNYFTPVGAWLLDSTRTTDLSGNGITLAETGTMRLSSSYAHGLASTRFSANDYLNSSDLSLNITGAWSSEIVACILTMTAGGALVTWAGNTEVEANNITWTLGRVSNGTGVIGGLYWERAAAADVNISEHGIMPTGEWFHLCQTRSAGGDFKTYINGVLTGSSNGLNMPIGGSTGRLSVGGIDVTMMNGFLAQYLAVYNTELSAANALFLAQKRLAGVGYP